jgi:hypothetical protein
MSRPPSGAASANATAAGEATLLVAEFPPPPFYYRTMAATAAWTPPPIPQAALERGTARAARAAAQAIAASERLRQHGDERTEDFLRGNTDVDMEEEEEDGDVVAVFGEIVEDPWLVQPTDDCQDPIVVRDELKRLNQQVLETFVKLVQDLVHRPTENKTTRDELSHRVFLMLQQCNKFREHQARELLIELLEKQLTRRKGLLHELETTVAQANAILEPTFPQPAV